MYLDVLRVPRQIPKALIESAVEFSYTYFDLPEDIILEIRFGRKNGAFVGVCDYDVDENAAYVYIYNGLNSSEIVKTIFHEIAHLSQHLSGQLKIPNGDSNIKIWNDVEYQRHLFTQVEYNSFPWEVDAIFHEDRMFEIFHANMNMINPELAAYLIEKEG